MISMNPDIFHNRSKPVDDPFCQCSLGSCCSPFSSLSGDSLLGGSDLLFSLWPGAFFPGGFRRQDKPFLVGFDAGQFTFHELFDCGDEKGVSFVRETDGSACRARPACTADPMHVIFRVMGQFEIDYMVHPLDMNTAPGNVRCHQDTEIFPALNSSRR